jgi:carotenoid cleavage dioxygenase-like enzyme
VVTIDDATPHERKLLATSSRQKHTPYMHSYGVTSDFVVLPYTPMAFSLLPGLENKPMEDSFSKTDPTATHFVAYPFDGSDPLVFAAPRPFTYNHLVNAYQNQSAIVFDVVSFQDASLFLTSGAAHIRVQVNKTARDALRDSSQRVWRYVLHLDGPLKGHVTDEPISLPGRAVEFPKINMKYSTKPHCIYYGQEWYHNDLEFGSMAVLKHDMCKGTRQYWYKPSTFPSEATFIARPGALKEDDGVLVFAVTYGVNGTSAFVMADGETMETLTEQPLPVAIPFATHGEWFDGLIGSSSPDSFSSMISSTAAAEFV